MKDEQLNHFSANKNITYISALKQKNIEALKEVIFNATVEENALSEQTIITNARHVAALEKVEESLNDVIDGLNNHLPSDLLALDIKRCLHYLGEITGEITNEEQLDYIFSKFCIGK